MRALILSDSHIPERAVWIPRPIEEYILSEGFDLVIHAGDVIEERFIRFIKERVTKDVFAVKGNMDYLKLPRYVKIQLESVELGVTHGDRVYPRGNIAVLTRFAHTIGVRVLVSGHTHMPFIVYDKSGVLHVNPGSITGVWGGGGGTGIPSFAELTVNSRTVTVTVFELVGHSILKKETYSHIF
ncbi:MAG: YfcE family phosphodiesterase [Sulfolobales archaeon]